MEPADFRPAQPEDHGLYLRFQPQLGTEDPPLAPQRWAKECAPTTAFLMEGDRSIGYTFWELAGTNAYVRHLVVEPDCRGRGHGRRLMLELASALRSQGASAWRLNVMSSNKVAIRLYESLGLAAIFSTVVLRLGWSEVERLPRTDARVSDADPRFDAQVEAQFGMMSAQLSHARERADVRVLAAELSSGACIGIAVFDPNFPGAFPFRCKPPEHLRALIEGMRERYRGTTPYVQLVIEDSAPIVQLLESAGARRVHDILHMRGAIPR